jgi:hypothetical protein
MQIFQLKGNYANILRLFLGHQNIVTALRSLREVDQ